MLQSSAPDYFNCTYEWFYNDDFISLIIYSSWNMGKFSSPRCLTLRRDSGEIVTIDDFAKHFSINKEALYPAVRESIRQNFETNPMHQAELSQRNDYLFERPQKDFIQFYINPDGVLHYVCPVARPNGMTSTAIVPLTLPLTLPLTELGKVR